MVILHATSREFVTLHDKIHEELKKMAQYWEDHVRYQTKSHWKLDEGMSNI